MIKTIVHCGEQKTDTILNFSKLILTPFTQLICKRKTSEVITVKLMILVLYRANNIGVKASIPSVNICNNNGHKEDGI